MDNKFKKLLKRAFKTTRRGESIDRLLQREALAIVLKNRAVDGVAYIYTRQRDCDCAEWDTVCTLPATVMAYEQYETHVYENAEGAVTVRIITQEQAEDFRPTHRDRAAEMMNY